MRQSFREPSHRDVDSLELDAAAMLRCACSVITITHIRKGVDDGFFMLLITSTHQWTSNIHP